MQNQKRINSTKAFSSPLEFQVARGEVRCCIIGCAVLGVGLVAAKYASSGIPLEHTTHDDDQNTSKTTTHFFSILSRHLLVPLEILVGSDSHAKQPDRADQSDGGDNRTE